MCRRREVPSEFLLRGPAGLFSGALCVITPALRHMTSIALRLLAAPSLVTAGHAAAWARQLLPTLSRWESGPHSLCARTCGRLGAVGSPGRCYSF